MCYANHTGSLFQGEKKMVTFVRGNARSNSIDGLICVLINYSDQPRLSQAITDIGHYITRMNNTSWQVKRS